MYSEKTAETQVIAKTDSTVNDEFGETGTYLSLGDYKFAETNDAAAFAGKMKDACIDASAQIYKANCLPAMLMKPPVIADEAVLDYIVDTIDVLLGK